jgi:SNF2 family DNA or RNA helicase
MRRYQHAGAQFIKDVRRCALFVEPGLGKTVTTLTAIRDMQLDIELGRVLVVGPPRVVKKTWPDEIRTWEHTRPITHTSLQCPIKQRQKRMKEATDIHLISADLIPWLDMETCGQHDYDMIVIDESTLFKSQGAKRWKAMRRLVAKCRYVVLLTGTPTAQGLADMWGQMYLVDGGARLGYDEKTYKERYFDQGWGEHATPTAKSFAEKRIKAKIEDVVFTLLGADYLKLPPLITNKIIVDLEPEMLKTYRKFVRQYVLEMKEGVGPINAVSAGALTQKLQQVANGIVLDKDKNAHELHRLKIDALRDLVEEAAGQPILVAYSHRADIARIKAEFPYAVELGNNPQTQADWNEGRIRMLLMHPKSGAHGLNLQHGGSLIVWFGLTWSAELHQQLIKRLHRSGQVNAVIVHYIMAAGTIDERIFDSLTTLGEDQARFMRSLSRIIEEEYKEAA